MTNLKKVLSLVLVLVMALGLMISASAATSVSDWDDIKNQEDVQLLGNLQIMQGRADGSFDPDGYLTRAEVAKMIYVARTGGVDDKAILFKGASNLFTDISGHWAEGYINFAAAKKLVSGRGNGKYDPNATITGYELLKIALTALGYDATTEGFTGADWKLNVAAAAMDAGLITGFTADPNLPITRDDAANIFANLVYANTISYNVLTNKAVVNADSFGEDYLNLVKVVGVLKANEYAGLNFNPNAAKTSWIDADADDAVDAGETIPATTDIGLLGYNVTALVSKNAAGAYVNVYGLDKTVGKNADIAVIPVINDPADTSPAYYLDYVASNAAGVAANADVVKYIDNNGNGKYDVVIGTEFTYKTVSKVSTTAGVVTADFVGGGSLTSTTSIGVSGLAKDDKVVYITKSAKMAKDIVTKIDGVAGTLTKYNAANVYADGVKYTYSTVAGATVATVTYENIGVAGTFYFFNGALLEFATPYVAPVAAKYAYVYNTGHEDPILGTRVYKVAAVLDDGTSAIYTVSKVDLDSDSTTAPTTPAADVAIGLYTYSIDTDGKIQLTLKTGADSTIASFDGTNKVTVGGASKYVDSTTTVFAKIGTKWVVYKGLSNIPALTNNVVAAAPIVLDQATVVYSKLITANDRLSVAVITDASITVSALPSFFMVLDTPVITGKTAITNLPIFTFKAYDSANNTVIDVQYIDNDTTPDVAKGKLYQLTLNNGYYTSADLYADADGEANADTKTYYEKTGVVSLIENNIIGFAGYDAAATPKYSTPVAMDYNSKTVFYKVNYANATVEKVTAADVAKVTLGSDGKVLETETANIKVIDNGTVVNYVFYIAG